MLFGWVELTLAHLSIGALSEQGTEQKISLITPIKKIIIIDIFFGVCWSHSCGQWTILLWGFIVFKSSSYFNWYTTAFDLAFHRTFYKFYKFIYAYLWFPLQSHNSTSQLAVLPGEISIPLHSNSRILPGEERRKCPFLNKL